MVSTEEVRKEESKELSELEIRTLKNLVDTLMQKGFLSMTTTTKSNTEEYRITAAVVPTTTTRSLTKLENDFIDEYKRLQKVIYVYSTLYFRYSGSTSSSLRSAHSEPKIGSDVISYPSALREIISSTIIEFNQQRLTDIYVSLTKDTQKRYKREELQDHIQNIRITTNEILYNFILLLKSIIQHNYPEVNFKKWEDDKEIDKFGSLSLLRSHRIPYLIIERDSEKTKPTRLLIIQNAPEEVLREIRQFIDEHRSILTALILNIKVTLVDDIIKDPKKFLEQKPTSVSSFTDSSFWYSSWRIIEIPSKEGLSLDDVIKAVLLWISDLYRVYSILNDGDTSLSEGRYQEAISRFDEAIEMQPNFAPALHRKAKSFLFLRKYVDAMNYLEKAISIDPYNVDAWTDKGYAFRKLGVYDEAIRCYDMALQIKPDHVDAWTDKGWALDELHRYDEAIRCYDMALQIKPYAASAWFGKGYALDGLRRYEEAISCYDKALELNPNYAHAWNNKGISLYNLGKYQEAIGCYEKALQIKPEYAQFWYNIGLALDRLGKKDADKFFMKARQLGHKD